MRPYCHVRVGAKSYTTSLQTGSQPKWKEEVKFEIEAQTEIHISVIHKTLIFSQIEVSLSQRI